VTPRALILGLGRFGGGREAAHFLARRGIPLRVVDRAAPDDLADAVAHLNDHVGEGIDWRLGDDSDVEGALDGVDRVVVNPAIPDGHPMLVAARRRGIPTTQEVELFLEHYPGRVLVVTGTDGKSSTATLLAAALRHAGLDTLLGGNIGHSLLADEDEWNARQVAVLEVSSFQLERIGAHRPLRHSWSGCVLTTLGRDHLDRHGSLAAYHASKGVAAALARDFVVHRAADPVASGFASGAALRVAWGPGGSGRAAIEDGWLRVDGRRLCHADALLMRGAFQAENALAAAVAATLCGADPAAAALGMCLAPPLQHRMQPLAPIAGAAIWDNGVSTAAASTIAAAEALRPHHSIHWVGGGVHKGDGAAPVADGLRHQIASAHVFGRVAAELAQAFDGGPPCSQHSRVQDALDAALAAARRGAAHRTAADLPPCVLFSPGFASFDQYPNFAARARDFRSWHAQNRGSTD